MSWPWVVVMIAAMFFGTICFTAWCDRNKKDEK